jgi:hypothetical protein
MNYFVMAAKVDELQLEAHLGNFPEDCPVESWEFLEGEALLHQIKGPIQFTFSERYPEGRKLIDLQHNSDRLHVISPRFKELLEGDAQIEFIPIQLLNHRGGVASNDYTIANFLSVGDCLDRDRSDYVKDSFDPDDIFGIRKFVVNEAGIPADANIFRLKGCLTTIIVKEPLKEKIEAAGMDGPLFVPVEEFDSALHLGV